LGRSVADSRELALARGLEDVDAALVTKALLSSALAQSVSFVE
jgi:hypothetical protein